MATVVEGASLESIHAIAADPPVKPNTTPLQGIQPLILYIARVPGSRDVFLTPMKPHQKVVTAEDVKRSIYYVHVNAEADYQEDEKRLSVIGGAKDAGCMTEVSMARPVLPPEIPTRPPPSTLSGPPQSMKPPVLPPHIDSGTRQIWRKPIASSPKLGYRLDQQPHLPNALNLPFRPQRRPRPLPNLPNEMLSEPSLHDDNIRLMQGFGCNEGEGPYPGEHTAHPETFRQQELDARPQPGTLTLIRRDPTSNEQWNVANIVDSRAQRPSSQSSLLPTAAQKTKQDGSPIYLDVTNPGYARFSDAELRAPSRNSTSSASSDSVPARSGGFRRQLYIPGTPYIQHEPYHSRHRQHSSISSTGSIDTLPSTRQERSPYLDPPDFRRKGKRNRYYEFTSPWNGTCRFTTSATDTSLKCMHAPVPGGLEQDVSELRFSLPIANAGNRITRPTSSYFQHKGRGLSFEDADTGRFDLSLGQEKAGGGFGGKQAKLGKLIIEREGYEMLDLLVAANISLWWRAYERLS